jgi:hypothetical protein
MNAVAPLLVEGFEGAPNADQIASRMIDLGAYVYFIPQGTKRCTASSWQLLATRDKDEVKRMVGNRHMNVMVVGKQDGIWVLDFDDVSVLEAYEKIHGRVNTYRVQSVSGGLHLYFLPSAAAWDMGNINGKDAKGGESWSARVDDRYVLAPFSTAYPDNDQTKPLTFYRAIDKDVKPIECPLTLIQWLKDDAGKSKTLVSQVVAANTSAPAPTAAPTIAPTLAKIPHGSINNFLASEAGKLHRAGLKGEALQDALLALAYERCELPLNDAEIKAVARSIDKYEVKNEDLILNQPQAVVARSTAVADEPEVLPVFNDRPYPVFPHWVMEGTVLYDKYVKPYCDVNSRIDYFMFLPAMAMLLNYVGPKIKIKEPLGERFFNGSLYMVIIGKKGKTNKSSSVKDDMELFRNIGALSHAGRDTKNAEGKILTWTAGSTEALGIGMQRTQCRNALLYYDELSGLVQKASIESSSVNTHLLTMYEADKFENSVKSTKESFSHDPNSYCVSLIACTTDKKFNELWGRLAGSDSGLDDRFMFVLEPKHLPEQSLRKYINSMEAGVAIKALVDKAVQRGNMSFDDADHPALKKLNDIENRYAIRAEKWAVAFAVLMGLESVDDECIERGVAIVHYEIAVKKFISVLESATREAEVQNKIYRILEEAGGRMPERELCRKANWTRYGTTFWGQAYGGLIKNRVVREEGTGKPGSPRVVQLLTKIAQEDDGGD